MTESVRRQLSVLQTTEAFLPLDSIQVAGFDLFLTAPASASGAEAIQRL